MFAWCCAEQSPKTSKEVRGFEDPSNAEADLLLDDIEVGSHCSKTSVAALPVLSEDKDLKEELPMTLTEMSQEKVLAEESTTEGHSGPKFSWEAGAGSGRRTRLELRAVDSHWRLESSEIHMKKELSKTLKSTLYLATWKGTEVVMKCVQIPEEPIGIKFSSESITASRPMQGNDVDEKLLEELLHEIELLSSLRHPDLVLFIGACLDKDSPVMCITEYMPGGDLERYYMAKRNQNQTDRWRPPLQQILDWCSAVARALSFLHTRDEPIVHRDLKPLNLLLTKHLEVKIADLGISKMMAAVASDVYNMTGGVGSWLYMAPEVVRHQHYNEKVDIYAFALIMFFMSAGKAPFHEMGKDPELVLKEYVKGNEPRPSDSECHSQLRPIMKAAWAVDYKERPSAERMVEQFQHVKEDYTPGGSCFCSKA
ncbi:unnamed protein product [Durusdinium trenchii]|uniref:Protein kinase domain-containing protein n=1 Tax=Durusdinium trenchii TaxID=1381693 RepID=A0ABP0PSM9_9DINO